MHHNLERVPMCELRHDARHDLKQQDKQVECQCSYHCAKQRRLRSLQPGWAWLQARRAVPFVYKLFQKFEIECPSNFGKKKPILFQSLLEKDQTFCHFLNPGGVTPFATALRPLPGTGAQHETGSFRDEGVIFPFTTQNARSLPSSNARLCSVQCCAPCETSAPHFQFLPVRNERTTFLTCSSV